MCCEGLDIMLLNSDGAMAKRGIPGRTDLTRPLTGRSVIVILGIFFGVMFIANGALIYAALSTLHGEETGELLRRQPGLQPADRRRARPERARLGRQRRHPPGRRRRARRRRLPRPRRRADRRPRGAGAFRPSLRPSAPTARRCCASDGEAYEGVAGPLHAGRWTLVIEASQDGQVKFTSDNKITLAETTAGD